MFDEWPSRARSIAAWGVGGALAVAGAFTAPILSLLKVGPTTVLVVGCLAVATGIGVGGYLAASARSGTSAESRAPRSEGVAWALAFLIAAAFVALPESSSRDEFAKPGEVNAVTWPPDQASLSRSSARVHYSPVQIRFFQAVPLSGALGGFLAAIVGARRRSLHDLGRSLLAAVMWALAAILAALVFIVGGSIFAAGLGRLFLPVSPIAGFVLGALATGALAGYLAGAIAEPARHAGA